MRKLATLCAMLAVVFTLSACANNATTAASQTIATIEGSYAALGTLASNYAEGKLSASVDKTVVAEMGIADSKVYSYIKALRTSAESGGSVSTDVLAAAEQALIDYQSLLQKNGLLTTTAAVSTTTVSK